MTGLVLGQPSNLEKISVALVPPKPKELVMAYLRRRSRACSGTQSRWHSSSWFIRLIVGGTMEVLSALMQIADSTAPAAPRRCPIIDLVELTQSRLSLACAPNTSEMARASSMSPAGVEVPCALM